MIHNKFRYLMTLALLLTAVTGAWAQATFGVKEITPDMVPDSWNGDNSAVTADDLAKWGFKEVTEAEALTWTGAPQQVTARLIYTISSGCESLDWEGGVQNGGSSYIRHNVIYLLVRNPDYSSEYDFFITTEPPLTVAWNASSKTGTFSMPGSDVELTPIYAPVAKWAVIDEVSQEPKAAEGVIAGTDAALITGGTVAKATDDDEAPLQGTAKFFVTTDEEMTAEQALAANGWLSTPPTAAAYDEATTVYVWYYIEGADTPEGDDPTAENTFNNTEICTTPLTVQVLTNKFDITFNAANALTIDATEASKGTISTKTGDSDAEDKTADIDEEGKLKQVKMGSEVKLNAKTGYKFRKVEVKKGAGKTITIGDMELTYADGDTWETIVSKNSDKIKTLSGRIVQVAQPAPNTYKYIHVWYTTVKPSDIIDPSKNYQWGTLEVNF